jgi:hypothetical protein
MFRRHSQLSIHLRCTKLWTRRCRVVLFFSSPHTHTPFSPSDSSSLHVICFVVSFQRVIVPLLHLVTLGDFSNSPHTSSLVVIYAKCFALPDFFTRALACADILTKGGTLQFVRSTTIPFTTFLKLLLVFFPFFLFLFPSASSSFPSFFSNVWKWSLNFKPSSFVFLK